MKSWVKSWMQIHPTSGLPVLSPFLERLSWHVRPWDSVFSYQARGYSESTAQGLRNPYFLPTTDSWFSEASRAVITINQTPIPHLEQQSSKLGILCLYNFTKVPKSCFLTKLCRECLHTHCTFKLKANLFIIKLYIIFLHIIIEFYISSSEFCF